MTNEPVRERTPGEKLAFMAGYAAAVETVERSGLETAVAALGLMGQTLTRAVDS